MDAKVIPGDSVTFEGAIPNAPGDLGKYTARATWQDDKGDWWSLGESVSFTISEPDPAAKATGCSGISSTLEQPADGATVIKGTTVIFTWSPANCAPNGYTFRITQTPNFDERPWIEDVGEGSTSHNYTFSTTGAFYWSARPCGPCTPFRPGEWATARRIEVKE